MYIMFENLLVTLNRKLLNIEKDKNSGPQGRGSDCMMGPKRSYNIIENNVQKHSSSLLLILNKND